MGREGPKPDVGDQISNRLHAQASMHRERCRPYPIPSVGDSLVAQTIVYWNPDFALSPLGENGPELATPPQVFPKREVSVKVDPRSLPSCPAPDMRVSDETIRPVLIYRDAGGVIAGDLIDLRDIAVAGEEIVTKTKEILPREAIVFENNAFIDVLEKPVDARYHPVANALVARLKLGLNGAVPVNFL